jgi:hypothetical protein
MVGSTAVRWTNSNAVASPQIGDLDIYTVWSAIGGGALRGNRGRAFWRNGDGFSVSLDRKKRCWFDHVAVKGGGILALVEIAIGDRRAALDWLAANFGVSSGKTFTTAERRAYAQRREKARAMAEKIVKKRDAVLRVIQDQERKHLEEFHRLERIARAEQCFETLIRADKEWVLMEELTAMRDLLSEAEGTELARLLMKSEAA